MNSNFKGSSNSPWIRLGWRNINVEQYLARLKRYSTLNLHRHYQLGFTLFLNAKDVVKKKQGQIFIHLCNFWIVRVWTSDTLGSLEDLPSLC